MRTPSSVVSAGGGYAYCVPSHTYLLSGFDRNNQTVEITDSIYGKTTYSINTVKNLFNKTNKQAVVLMTANQVSSIMKGEDGVYSPADLKTGN